jgi:succinate dehydrogenase flavin-adding protein (antitoxin of CptAB toxin-antitoxin module)
MTKVFIELEFESQSVSDRDVYDYLKELMDNECLDWDTNKTLIPNRMRS